MGVTDRLINIPFVKKTIKKSVLFDIVNPLRDRMRRVKTEYYGGMISKVTIKELLQKEDPVILDIGANDGDDSVEFLQHFKRARVYSFEPLPENIRKMEENIGRYMKRHPRAFCKIYNVAVSNKDGETTLLLVDHDPLLAQSSIVKPKNIIGKRTYAGIPKKFDKKTTCKTITIDTWTRKEGINFIDFMWVDIEGAERLFIEGARETLREKTRYLYTEYADDENFEGSPNVRDILNLLPEFRIVRLWEDNVLLENRKFDYLKGKPSSP